MSLWQFNAAVDGYMRAHGIQRAAAWTQEDQAWFDSLPDKI